ncbi:MAG: activator of (R)-2-hydroxyglutaryl-CoA dehydratase [Chlorobi bacterium]|nr:activator of (R)-2-hydroxyglutaryl-CoA dehydratase [Chlorobiota bacterium]
MGANRPGQVHHYRRPAELPFTREQRERTTILFGGLTTAHEYLIAAAWRGLGYNCEPLPLPDVEAYQIGREFSDNGQCNPTYFTVGNLVKYLRRLESSGMSKADILDRYVFLTAGACGPCRFGMYEATFRLALRNSGFDGFRVLLFQQLNGLDQSDGETGLDMNYDFFLGLINALNIGDAVNELVWQVRPYEVEPGATDRVRDEALRFLHDLLKNQPAIEQAPRWKNLLDGTRFEKKAQYLVKTWRQLSRRDLTEAMQHVRSLFDTVAIDRFRVKPVVKITGEFWAQITEGDGNFNMFRFLEDEGAEIMVEPIGTWLLYLIAQHKQFLRDRRGLPDDGKRLSPWRIDRRATLYLRYLRRMTVMNLTERVFIREYTRLQDALSPTLHRLIDQEELQRLGSPYFNTRAEGGEGHLEIAKNIYYHIHGLSHMVLSVKPFGCMPSTQSDGAQAAVTEHHRDLIYLPIETSGEGEINAHSRVQMVLNSARHKAREEFDRALASTGRTLDEMRAFVDRHPELKKPTYSVPKKDDVVGSAANFILHVAEMMKR